MNSASGCSLAVTMSMIPSLLCSEQGIVMTFSPASNSGLLPSSAAGTMNGHSTLDIFANASLDLSILEDHRVLEKMLALQMAVLPSDKYLTDPNGDITPKMRKIVVKWMLEICYEQKCEDQVFLVAVNLLDRFLNTTTVKRTQLQLCACVCLLLASKLRQCSYLSVDLLVYYTDECVTTEEVRKWELLVVSKLKWEICPITAVDFIEVILHQIPTAVSNEETLRKHVSTLIALAATERRFIGTPPSCIAGASIAASIQGLTRCSLSAMTPFLTDVSDKLKSSIEELTTILCAIEDCLQKSSGPEPDDMDVDGSNQQHYSKLQEMADHDDEMMNITGKETPVDGSEVDVYL